MSRMSENSDRAVTFARGPVGALTGGHLFHVEQHGSIRAVKPPASHPDRPVGVFPGKSALYEPTIKLKAQKDDVIVHIAV
jgi:hypothetical protein